MPGTGPVPASTLPGGPAWLPGLALLRSYRRAWLRPDLVAGVTIAAYLVPQCMAYGELAGLDPVVGLWAALAPMLVYVVLGSSPQLSIGPESTTAIMVAVAVGPLAAGDPSRYAALAAGAAIAVGLVCLVGYLLRLGFLADLLSRPVLVGYMAGVALIMISGQLEKLTGVPVDGDTAMAQIRDFFSDIAQVDWPTLVFGLSILAFLFLVQWLAPRLPAQLLAVVLSTIVVAVFDLEAHGIAVVGRIPAGLPHVGLPSVSGSDLLPLLVAGLGIAVVGYSDNVVTARSFAARHDYEIDANQELLALGVANVGAGLTSGFAVSSSGTRTAVGERAGGRTQAWALSTFAVLVLVLVAFRGVLASFPSAALGAIVIQAAVGLVEVPQFRRFARFRRSELLLALAAGMGVVLFDVLYGILIAVGLSIIELFARIARPHDGILGEVPGLPGLHDVDDYPEARRTPGLVVYRYDAPLCFANAADFKKRALASVDDAPYHVDWFVLNAEANVEIDLTACDVIDDLRGELERRDVVFTMARVKQDLADQLDRAGLLARIGADRIFPTLPTAVAAFGERPVEEGGAAR